MKSKKAKIRLLLIIGILTFGQSLFAQVQGWDPVDFWGTKSVKVYTTPVTDLPDTTKPVAPYNNSWMLFDGIAHKQFMRTRNLPYTQFINSVSDTITIEFGYSVGLPRKAMYFFGHSNGDTIGWLVGFGINSGAAILDLKWFKNFYQLDTLDATDSAGIKAGRIQVVKSAGTIKYWADGVLNASYTGVSWYSGTITNVLTVGHAFSTQSYDDPTDGDLSPTTHFMNGKLDYLYIHKKYLATDSAVQYDFNNVTGQYAYDYYTYLDIDATTPDGFRGGAHLVNGVGPGPDSSEATFSRGFRKGITNVTALGTGLKKWSEAAGWYINSFTNGQRILNNGNYVFTGEINYANVTAGVWSHPTDTMNNVAKWNGTTYSKIGPNGSFFTGTVTQAYSYGTGDTIFAGGTFVNAGGLANADYVVMYKGTKWDTCSKGFDEAVNCFTEFNSQIYAGGYFDSSGTTPLPSRVARWDYDHWTAVGTNSIAIVWSLDSYNGVLYAGTQQGLYWLNGSTWTLVANTDFCIYDMQVYRDELYLAGIEFLAKMSAGQSITSLGTMYGFEKHGIAWASDTTDLYLVGSFWSIIYNGYGTVCNKLARWNGERWSAVNFGADLRPEDAGHLRVVNNKLVMSGDFYSIDGVPCQNTAEINTDLSLIDTSHAVITHTSLTDTAEFNFPLTVNLTAIKANGTALDSAYIIWKKGANGTEYTVKLTAGTSGAYSGLIAQDTSLSVTGDTIFYTPYTRDLAHTLTTGSTYSFTILPNPTDYRTTLIYCFWGDSLTTGSPTVSVWGNTVDTLKARQSTVGDRPTVVTNVINGHSVIRFATADYFNLPTITLTNFTVTFAIKSTENIDNYVIATPGQGIFNSLNALGYGIGGFDGTRLRAATTAGLDNNWHIITVTNAKVFVDGVEKSYAAAQTLTGIEFTTLGGRVDVSMFFKGDLACLRIYNSQLSTTNRIIEEGAINSKLLIY